MLKRVIVLVIVVLVSTPLFVSNVIAQIIQLPNDTLKVMDVSGRVGDTAVWVSINLRNSISVSVFSLRLAFDENLIVPKEIIIGTDTFIMAVATARDTFFVDHPEDRIKFFAGSRQDSILTFLAASLDSFSYQDTIASGSGPVLRIQFMISPTITGDTSTSIRFSDDTLGNYNVFVHATHESMDTYKPRLTDGTLRVREAGNQRPKLTAISNKTAGIVCSLFVSVSATDPDGTIPHLFCDSMPRNATFYDNLDGTGVFKFAPDSSQVDSIYKVIFIASDESLADSVRVTITVTEYVTGDANGDCNVSISDVVYIVNYLYKGGPPPNPFKAGDANCDGKISISDVVYLINYLYKNGPLPNRAPVFEPLASQFEVSEWQTLTFTVSASDQDGDTVTLSADTLPPNAIFSTVKGDSAVSQTFSFSPDSTQQGLKQIIFYATDGILTDHKDVLIQVVDAINHRPILQPIAPDSIMEGDSLIILVHADDPDSTIPHLSACTLPINASFTDSENGNGIFMFKPVYVQSGVYGIRFIASDGYLADTETVLITVLEAGNQPPVLSIPYDSTSVYEGATLSFRVRGIDPDSTIPILRVTNLPANATFTDSLNGKGGFRLLPNYSQAGNYVAYFQALDSEDTLITSVDSVKITVINVNQKPKFTQCISSTSTHEGDTLIINVKATDDDGTIPILNVIPHLNNSVFVDSGNGVGTLIFYPDYTQGNNNPNTYSLSFIAIDSEYLSDTSYCPQLTTLILVYNVPMPPIIMPINDTSVIEGDNLSLYVYAVDLDSTVPILNAFNLPTNSSFSLIGVNNVGRFSFSPSFTQAGVYTVGFVAKDPTNLADTELVQITVIEAGNQKPKLAAISDKTAAINEILSFKVSATDPDGTIPHLFADSLPTNSSFYDSLNGSGLFTFTPDSTQADSAYRVIFIASDDSLADSALVTISVIEYVKGDANGDRKVSVSDVVYLINYLFKGGPSPIPLLAGDVNCDSKVNVTDIVYLINYLFKGGPPPCS